NADDPPELAQYHRLNDELLHHVALLRANGFPDADLSCPFRNRDKHDVHDAYTRSQQSNGAYDEHAEPEVERELIELLDERIVGEVTEVVLFTRPEVAGSSQNGDGLLDRIVHYFTAYGLHHNMEALLRSPVLLEVRQQGD